MHDEYLVQVVEHLKERGIEFEVGLTEAETALIERTYSFQFPPDLLQFLRKTLPVSRWFPNWRHGSQAEIRTILDRPLEGIIFDIEANWCWLEEWGAKPVQLADAISIAKRAVANAPVLVPVYSQRYITGEPGLAGNPVFSVMQTDIIHYGNDLASYFTNEFRVPKPSWAATKPRPIRFWDDIVRYNNKRVE